MRRPKNVLVIDASILIAMVRGRSRGALIAACEKRAIVVTDRTIAETRRRIELGLRSPDLVPVLEAALEAVSIVYVSELEPVIASAADWLRDAVASRNGAIDDAHLLACAWRVDGDIWSFDRDFAGTGVASWSTANLIRALANDQAPRS